MFSIGWSCLILFKTLVSVVRGHWDRWTQISPRLIKIVFHPYINIIVTYATENFAFMVLHKNSPLQKISKFITCHHSNRGMSVVMRNKDEQHIRKHILSYFKNGLKLITTEGCIYRLEFLLLSIITLDKPHISGTYSPKLASFEGFICTWLKSKLLFYYIHVCYNVN